MEWNKYNDNLKRENKWLQNDFGPNMIDYKRFAMQRPRKKSKL
jgi:hypothetical protein